jgi:hypothetical protein
MRRWFSAVVLLLAPAIAGAGEVGLGVGVELPPVTVTEEAYFGYEQRLVSLEVPVLLGRWRLAPAAGYASGRERATFLPGKEIDTTRLSLGGSAAWVIPATERLRGWAGVRGGVVWREWEGGSRGTDPFAGGLVGGEYFLAPWFSLGADLRVTYQSQDGGDARLGPRPTIYLGTASPTGNYLLPVTVPDSAWVLLADAAVSLRFYPW